MKTPDTALYPWQLDPKLAPAIWGGGELVRNYGKHGDPHAGLGESWECWDADAVTNGAVKGSTLAMLRERLGAEFFSATLTRRRFFRSSPRSSPRMTGSRCRCIPTMRMRNASSTNPSARPNAGM